MKIKTVFLSGVAAMMFAGPASAETLQEALALAYQSNPTLQAARAQLRAVDETVPIALSGWRPSLSVSGNVTRQRSESEITGDTGAGPVTNSGTTLRTSQQAGVSLTQPLFRGFRTVAGTAQAEATVLAQRARLESSEAAVLLEAATAYIDVLRDQAVLDLQVNNVQVLNRQLEATQDRFRVGEITRTDVAQSEARLSGAAAQRIRAEGQLQTSRANYENVIGKAPENLMQPPQPAGLPVSAEAAVQAADSSNPAFIAAGYTAEAAEKSIDLVRGELLPSVNLVASYSRAWDTQADQSLNKNAQAQATVVVPLYQQGQEYARLRQSKHTYNQRRLETDQARLDARESATAAWENYQSTSASISSLESQITASQIALEGVQREAEVGSRTILDVLNAEQELLSARVNLVTAQRDQLVAAYQLLAAVGALTGGDIGLAVDVYDPAAHYQDVKYQAFGAGVPTN